MSGFRHTVSLVSPIVTSYSPNLAPEGTTAIQALEKGLRDLQELCDVVATKYWEAKEDFENQMES
jgi:hypothetical protein